MERVVDFIDRVYDGIRDFNFLIGFFDGDSGFFTRFMRNMMDIINLINNKGYF